VYARAGLGREANATGAKDAKGRNGYCAPVVGHPEKGNLRGIGAGMAQMKGYTSFFSGVGTYTGGYPTYTSAAWTNIEDVDSVKRASVDTMFIVGVCMGYKGRILLWTIPANDQALLNQVLTVSVQFGKETPFRLFPMDVQPSKK
jgi:hypothetical protein